MKVVTDSLETDVHWAAVRNAPGRDGADYIPSHEIPPSRVAKQVIDPRVPRSWLDHLSDENLDVVNTAVETWVSEDILGTCASVERVSEPYYCGSGMTTIFMEDVNTGYALQYAHPADNCSLL